MPGLSLRPLTGTEADLLSEIAPPYYVDGRLLLPPQFQWGSRIANPPPNLVYPNFVGVNRMDDVTISATKLVRSHTLKAGFFFQHSYKVQSLGQAAGAIPFTGLLNFANDTNNPIDTGFGYANAAAGIFSTYGQQSKLIEGVYVFDSIDWYLQDNWKVNSRLTLDYGLRFSHWQPQHDQGLQASNFFVDQWSSTRRRCSTSLTPCQRQPLRRRLRSGCQFRVSDRRLSRRRHGVGDRNHRARLRQHRQRADSGRQGDRKREHDLPRVVHRSEIRPRVLI